MMNFREVYLRKKFWIQDFLHGGNMWKSYKDVMHIFNNQDIGGGKREKYLQDILRFASANVTFYKPYKGCSIKDYPVINKSDILAAYNDFLTPVSKIPGQVGKVHIQKTSGSTGTPFEVYQDTRCRTRRIATIKVENEAIDFHSFEPMMHLRATAHYWGGNLETIHHNKSLNIYYVNNANLTDAKLQLIVNAINQHKIKVIRGYMTSLDALTRYAVKHHIKFEHSPFFISVGELLLESLRLRIVEQLKCHVISQYGNEENGIFGSSEIDGKGTNIRLNRANCYVEILKMESDEPVSDGEIGRIVVTDFTNYAMPMIRYEIGDLAAIGKTASDGTILSITHLCGRKTDMIYKTNGEAIDIFNSMPIEIYNNPQVKQWQFIQKGEKQYTLRLAFEKEDKTAIEVAERELKKLLGNDALIDIVCVDEIPVMNSGKRKIVINELKKKN